MDSPTVQSQCSHPPNICDDDTSLVSCHVRCFTLQQLQVPPGSVSLSATFPSRLLPATSDEKTLMELGLCPSSTIIVRTKVRPSYVYAHIYCTIYVIIYVRIVYYRIAGKNCSIKFRDFALERTFCNLCADIMRLYCDINKFAV